MMLSNKSLIHPKSARGIIQTLILFLLITSLSGCGKEEAPSRPNVLFVLMDDLGYGQYALHNDTLKIAQLDPFYVKLVDSLEGYDPAEALEFSKQAMPFISQLAKEGVRFTNAFTPSNICAPSRLGIATGVLQTKFGVYTNIDMDRTGILPNTHLAEKLQEIGYNTAHIGKWHIGTQDEQMVSDAKKRHGLSDTLPLSKIKEQHPEIHKEIYDAGYMGSVKREHHPLNHGFDYYYGYNYWASQFYNSNIVWENYEHAGIQKRYNTDTFTDKALDYLEKKKDDDAPFYLQLHYHAVHDSLEPKAPPKYFDKFKSDSYTLNNFYAHIYAVDRNMKRIVAYLKEKGQYENTIIVFTSDNGAMAAGSYKGHKTGSPLPGNAPYAGHKGNYFQGGMRVPLFFHWPKGIAKGFESSEMVSAMDILPTAIAAAGGHLPEGIDGKNVLPLLTNQQPEGGHEHLIWAGIHATKWGFLNMKSTKSLDTEDKYAPGAWAILKDDYLLRFIGTLEPGLYYDHLDGRKPIMELYNVKHDPAERNDLSQEMPEKVKELSLLYFNQSKDYPPPAKWPKEKWNELRAGID